MVFWLTIPQMSKGAETSISLGFLVMYAEEMQRLLQLIFPEWTPRIITICKPRLGIQVSFIERSRTEMQEGFDIFRDALVFAWS
jgi:hypothetical protein